MARNVPKESKSTSKKVKDSLNKRPFLVNAMLQDIVNYSALARKIQKEIGSGATIEAVKTSLIREKRNLNRLASFNEERILRLLKNSRIELRDKIAVVIAGRTLIMDYITSSIVTSGNSRNYVYIADQTSLDVKEDEKTSITKNLVALVIKSPDELEMIPGVVAFITQALAANGINIREFISCYTDTVMVFEKQDGLKAFDLLQKYV